MNIQKRNLEPYSRNLTEFFGKTMSVKGIIKLRVTLRPSIVSMDVHFLVVDTLNNAYNAILRRTSLNNIRVIVSTPYLLMKFPTSYRVGQVQVDQVTARKCYITNL